jgi:hypothetical protein
MLNTPMALLAVTTVVVGVNSFLYFGFYLPRTTPPSFSPPAQPEQTERTTTTQPTTPVEQTTTQPRTTPEGTTTSTATPTATATPSP